jgi:DNA-binding MarR family transcriptional regulator
MNQIIFRTKRAFHGFLRVTRKPLALYGLTAARFDMMFALLPGANNQGWRGYAALQSNLRRTLGVSAPVVSRMLRSLEELGWVTRRRPASGDTRQRYVRLTDAGVGCIRAASQALLPAARRLVHRAISFGRHRDEAEWFRHMATLESYLLQVGTYCDDTATLWYPWHPDD